MFTSVIVGFHRVHLHLRVIVDILGNDGLYPFFGVKWTVAKEAFWNKNDLKN